jgi:hypothetical protein
VLEYVFVLWETGKWFVHIAVIFYRKGCSIVAPGFVVTGE